MYSNNLFTKINSYIMIAVVVMMFVMNMSNQQIAVAKDNHDIKNNNERVDVNHKKSEFENSYDNYVYTRNKVDDEINNVTGVIDEKIEKKLNKKGVFDEEIKGMDINTIEELEDVDIDRISVETVFFNYIEKLDQDGNIVETGYVEMDSETINEAIGEKYYDNKIKDGKQDNKKDKSILKNIGESLGITPIEVYAASTMKYSTNSAMMKKTVIISPMSNGYYKMYCSCVWLDMPIYRCIDLMQVYWSNNAEYLNDSFQRKNSYFSEMYMYTEREYGQQAGHVVVSSTSYGSEDKKYVMDGAAKTLDNKYELNGGHYVITDNYMASAIDLPEDISNGSKTYDGAVLSCAIYLKLKENTDNFDYKVVYEHTKYKANVKIKGLIVKFDNAIVNILQLAALNMDVISYSKAKSDFCGGDNHNNYNININYYCYK